MAVLSSLVAAYCIANPQPRPQYRRSFRSPSCGASVKDNGRSSALTGPRDTYAASFINSSLARRICGAVALSRVCCWTAGRPL